MQVLREALGHHTDAIRVSCKHLNPIEQHIVTDDVIDHGEHLSRIYSMIMATAADCPSGTRVRLACFMSKLKGLGCCMQK